MKLSVAIFAIVALSTKAVNAQQVPPKVDTLAPDGLPIFGTIAGYNPTTQVVDHMSIDLDKKAVDELLADKTVESFLKARKLYREGAHRRSYATLTLTEPLGFALKKDAHFFFGKTAQGKVVTGNAYEDYVVNSTKIGIRYTTIDDQATYQTCTVGALTTGQMNLAGCFAPTGSVKMMSNDPKLVYKYTYDPLTANKSPRPLRYFSTNFELHTDSVYALNYYGKPQYADEWVEAAFNATSTNYTNGGADFSAMGFEGRAEAINTGIVVLHSFMYAINECSNHTQKYCGGGSGLPGQPGFTNYAYWKTLHAWDECPAFFTGSMDAAKPGTGNLVYNMVNKQCPEWKTCGPLGKSVTGTAKVILDTWKLLQEGRDKILAGNCIGTVSTKDEIAKKWYIPLIQGTMSCAYKLFIFRSDKLVANCATFAAAVLPRVHAADPVHATTIYENTKVGALSTDYTAVWAAFEGVYAALGITAADVGVYQGFKPTRKPTKKPVK